MNSLISAVLYPDTRYARQQRRALREQAIENAKKVESTYASIYGVYHLISLLLLGTIDPPKVSKMVKATTTTNGQVSPWTKANSGTTSTKTKKCSQLSLSWRTLTLIPSFTTLQNHIRHLHRFINPHLARNQFQNRKQYLYRRNPRFRKFATRRKKRAKPNVSSSSHDEQKRQSVLVEMLPVKPRTRRNRAIQKGDIVVFGICASSRSSIGPLVLAPVGTESLRKN